MHFKNNSDYHGEHTPLCVYTTTGVEAIVEPSALQPVLYHVHIALVSGILGLMHGQNATKVLPFLPRNFVV